MIGASVPANLLALSKKELHAFHADCDKEILEIREKQTRVRDLITSHDQMESLKNRAGFDTTLVMPPSGAKFTLGEAKDFAAGAAKGLFAAPAAMLDRIKRIIDSGKDEE